jgi:acyl-CoA reductase-like NAD-dependent aldehyde dehydrogenase
MDKPDYSHTDSKPVSFRDLLGPPQQGVDGTTRVMSLVGGSPFDGSGSEVGRFSPATGDQLFVASALTDRELDRTVAIARGAFEDGPWARSTGRERSRVLRRAGEILQDRSEAFAQLIVAESGKPIREARGEVEAAVNIFEYFAGLARDIGGRTVRDIAPGLLAFTLREPAGVAGLIVPWNFPLAILCQKLPPALAVGCTAVVKPSPMTPLSSLALGNLLTEAGLPPGVVNVVVGEAPVGARLVEHPDVDVVSFTGSTATARAISATAGSRRLKRVAVEAGGKTPVLVLADADIDRTVEGVLFGSFFNQGECCVAGSRILVQESVGDEFTERLSQRAAEIKLGDPYQEATEMGPMVSAEHGDRVLGMLKQGIEEGGRIRTGGVEAVPTQYSGGPYLAPTVVDEVGPANLLAREEVFGPVTAVQSFGSLEEGVTVANDSPYALAACVWTRDLDRALTTTLRLKAGTVWINGGIDAFPELPLGGRRDSGFEPELGREGMEFFTNVKTVQAVLKRRPDWYA